MVRRSPLFQKRKEERDGKNEEIEKIDPVKRIHSFIEPYFGTAVQAFLEEGGFEKVKRENGGKNPGLNPSTHLSLSKKIILNPKELSRYQL